MGKCPIGIGFHCGVPSHMDGWGTYIDSLAANGHAIHGKGADNGGVPYQIQRRVEMGYDGPASGIYRLTSFPHGDDVPRYGTDPQAEAQYYWNHIMSNWPGELDPAWVWVEFPNEIDKNQSEWVGEFCYEAGLIAVTNGWRFITPGWSGGEPEPEHWAYFADYLQLCADNPGRLGVSVHEYTFDPKVRMLDTTPWLIGRVQYLNAYCETELHIPPPPVFISEWGWGAQSAPHANTAVPQIIETIEWYIHSAPNVQAVAIWALDKDPKWGSSLPNTVNSYMVPLANAINAYDWPEKPTTPPPVDPPPESGHKVVVAKYAQEHTESDYVRVCLDAFPEKRTVTASHDDTITMLDAGNSRSFAIIYDAWMKSQQHTIAALESRNLQYETRQISTPPPPSVPDLFAYRPCDTKRVTQPFGANPDWYEQFGLPGHEGIDYGVAMGDPFYVVQNGTVVHASNKTPGGAPSNYGWHVYVEHDHAGHTFHTVYAHAAPNLPVQVGDQLSAGDIVGYSGNTGNSTGPHLHFGLLWPTDTGNGYPMWTYGQCINPTPFLHGKDAPPPTDTGIEIVPFIRGDGRLYEVQNEWGSQERFQTQIPGGTGEFWQTKNHLAEQLYYDNSYVYRGWDTSPGNGRFYQQQQPAGSVSAPWLPSVMAVGQEFTVSLHVQFYDWDCNPSDPNSGPVTDTRRLVAHHRTWTSRFGLVLNNVIEIKWLNGGETYFYAAGYGLVGWERDHYDPHTPEWSSISEIHQPGARPDNKVELPPCLIR